MRARRTYFSSIFFFVDTPGAQAGWHKVGGCLKVYEDRNGLVTEALRRNATRIRTGYFDDETVPAFQALVGCVTGVGHASGGRVGTEQGRSSGGRKEDGWGTMLCGLPNMHLGWGPGAPPCVHTHRLTHTHARTTHSTVLHYGTSGLTAHREVYNVHGKKGVGCFNDLNINLRPRSGAGRALPSR